MNLDELTRHYDFSGRVVVVTGGAGILGGGIACALAGCNASVVILDREPAGAERLLPRLKTAKGRAMVIECDVLKKASIELASQRIIADWGQVDCLINGAGGNNPGATTGATGLFSISPKMPYGLSPISTCWEQSCPSQVFGKLMANAEEGVILNISSMNAFRPLTRIPAYSAAKAAVSNFTQWLAVHMAQEYSPRIRVNAIAPGFFLTEQNRLSPDGQEARANGLPAVSRSWPTPRCAGSASPKIFSGQCCGSSRRCPNS